MEEGLFNIYDPLAKIVGQVTGRPTVAGAFDRVLNWGWEITNRSLSIPNQILGGGPIGSLPTQAGRRMQVQVRGHHFHGGTLHGYYGDVESYAQEMADIITDLSRQVSIDDLKKYLMPLKVEVLALISMGRTRPDTSARVQAQVQEMLRKLEDAKYFINKLLERRDSEYLAQDLLAAAESLRKLAE